MRSSVGATDILRELARQDLRLRICESLQKQGFRIDDGRITPVDMSSKDAVRELHTDAVMHLRERSRAGLERHEGTLLKWIAAGTEVHPEKVTPELVEVQKGTFEELVFRWVRLHWSIPISAGYGRRLRFLVMDRSNEKLIGIIGLSDPVFALGARDRAIGWTPEDRRQRLRHVLDAFVLGAVPPYNSLRFGKLVALFAASNEVRSAFGRKYRNRASLIGERSDSARLAMVTTTSALGRSSLYNRLQFSDETVFRATGYTAGFGDFQFLNGSYSLLSEYADRYLVATAKHNRWGSGFRNRRELVRKVLSDIGLSLDFQNHGVKRQVFLVPTARNSEAFLRGEAQRLRYWDRPTNALFSHFRHRWLIPRARDFDDYQDFDRASYALWGSELGS